MKRVAFYCLMFAVRGLQSQPAKTWTLTPVATIEGPSAADPFGVIRGIALHPDGRLLVVEADGKRVSMFDATGKFRRIVGREGAGPGEYRLPYYAAWFADTVAVFDPGQSRLVYLTNGSIPLRVAPAQRITGDIYVRFYPVSPTKAYLVGSRISGTQSQSVFVGYDASGARDTVAVPQVPVGSSGATCNRSDGGISYFSWPEAPRRIVVPVRADGMLAIASSGVYEIKLQTSAGAVLQIIRRTIPAVSLPDDMWNVRLADYRKHVATFGSASCSATPVRPDHMAPIRAITVSTQGDVWVTALVPGRRVFDVYSPSGTYKATLIAPEHIERLPIAVTETHLALVAEDANGAQVVQLFRIVR